MRHECISFTAIAVGIADLLQLVRGDLDQVNVPIPLKSSPVNSTVPSDLVNMVRANSYSTTVFRPERDILKRDAHQAWLPVLLRPVAGVLEVIATLHLANLGCEPIARNKSGRNDKMSGALEPNL